MESFFTHFSQMAKCEGDLNRFIQQHSSRLSREAESPLTDSRNDGNVAPAKEDTTEAPEMPESSEDKENQTGNKKDFEGRTQEERMEQFKIFVLKHGKDSRIDICQFDRLSKDGKNINKINSKYLNQK